MKTTTPRLFSATRHAGNFFLATLFMLLAARDASAQSTYYWVGRDTSPTFFGAYWSYNNNFSTSSGGGGLGSTIPSLQNYLNFDGAAVGGYTSTNDFAAGSGGFQIYFKSGASAYNLYGNSITFYNFNVSGTPTDPNIQNEGATVQTINFPIVDGNSSGANGILNININPGGAGPLVFNGSLSALDAAIATRAINISNTAAITFNGVISDFSSSGKIALTQLAANTITLAGTNTYSGQTTLASGGTLNINNATALGTGTLALNGNATNDNTSGAAITLANNNPLTLSGGSLTFLGTSNLNFGTGIVTISGANRTLTVASNTLTLGGGVTDAGGAKKLTKAGAGALILNAAAGTWTGGSSVDAGTLTIGTDTTLGTGNVALNGGTLVAGNGARVLANSASLIASSTIGGTNNLTVNGGFTNSGGSRTLTVLNTGTTTLAGNIFLSDNDTTTGRALTITNVGPVIISGSISNNNAGNTVAASLTYLGTNTLTLSGANNFSGAATISGGTVIAASTSAFTTTAGVTLSGTVGTSTLDVQTDGSDVAYPVSFGSAAIGSTVASDVKTGSVGINHTLGSLGTGNSTLNIVKGLNVASGNPAITFGTVSLNAGTAGTTILNPTTASLSLGAVSIASGSNPKTLQLDGTNTNNTITGAIANNLNVLTVTKANTGTWTLSNAGNAYSGNTTVSGGTLNLTGGSGVTNGLFVNTAGTLTLSGTFGTNAITANNFIIGQTAGRGVLNILSGATVPRVNMFVGDGAAGDGAVYQSGGTVMLSQAAGIDNLRVGSTTGGKGYYKLTGGSVTAVRPAIGASLADTIGVFDMTNGTLTSTEQLHIAAGSATSSGLLNVMGGTVSAGTDIRMLAQVAGTAGASQLALLNVGGGTGAASVTTGNNAGQGVNLAQTANIAGEISVVNLLTNGTLTTSRILGTQLNPTLHFNFNGGKLKANTTVANPLFNDSGVDAINVYSSGGTIDNSGVAVTLGRPLLAPIGTGVTSITGPSTQGSNYIGAPLVVITGGTGSGATAYAVMADDGSGKTLKVASIVVTSPGLYTVAPTTVTLFGGGAGNVASGFTINTAANTSGGMTFIGSGATTLNGVNTYSGATSVSAGELVGSTASSLSNSPVTVASGATNGVSLATAGGQFVCSGLTYSAGTTYADFNFVGFAPSTTTAPLLVNGNLAFTGTPNIIVRSAGATVVGQYPLIKYTGTLSGTPPTVALSLPSRMSATISNNVANSSIDLVVTVGNAVNWAVGNGNWDINTTANWKNSGGSAVNYLDGDAVVLDDTATGASPLTLTLSASVTPTAITANLTNKNYTIVSNAFSFLGSAPLIKNGPGGLIINSTNNLFTGGISINGGAITNANASTLGSGTVTMANGTSWLLGSGGNTFVGNPITVAPGASVSLSAQGGLGSAFSGVISGDSASTINIVDTTSFDRTFNQFSNFFGTVTLNASKTLRFSANSSGNTFGGSNATFNVLGTLQPRNAGNTVSLGAVTGSGSLSGPQSNAGSGTTTYSIGFKNIDSTFSGNIASNTAVAGAFHALTKVGNANLTLSGNCTLSGATTVSAGTLTGVTGGSCSNSAVTVNSGATNAVTVTVAGGIWTCTNLTYAAGTETAVFNFGVNTPSTTVAPLQVQSGVTISGTLNILINGGSTTIPVGTYPLIKYTGTQTGLANSNILSLPLGVYGYIGNDTASKQIVLIVTNVIIPSLVWTAGSGNWDATSVNWTNVLGGGLTNWLDNYLAQFDDTASGAGPFTVTLTTNVNPIGVLFTNSTKDYTLAGGTITGSGTLTKTGTGKLTLLTTNAATGGIAVTAGTLLGNHATLIGNIANNAAIIFNQAANGSNNAVISGTGSVTKTNAGILALGGVNNFTGNVGVNQGTLAIGSGANLGAARSSATPNAITIDGATLLATNGAATITLPANAGLTVGNSGAAIDVASGLTLDYPAQAISGTGTLTKNGAGTFQIDEGTASSTYTSLILNAGTIAFNKSSGGLGAGSLTINGGTIRTTGASSRSPNNSSILVNGDFTLGSSTTAAISFSGGGAWTLANGNRTFNIDTITATLTGVIDDGGNNYQLIKSGSGTLVLQNADTFSGGIAINNGNLNLANNNAAGPGSTIAYSGGSVQIGSGITVTNAFNNGSSTTSDLMMDCPTGTGIWAGPVTSSGAGGFRPGTSGGTLIFTGNGSLGSKNLIVPRGTVVFATNANFSTTGTTIAFGRSTSGSGTSITVQNSATLSLTGVNGWQLGGAQASPGPIVVTIQDSGSVSSGSQLFDLHNSTSGTATTAVNLNGGSLTVGSFVKSQTGGSQTTTLSLNGGTLQAGQTSASFLPALTGLTANVSTGGALFNDNGFNVTIAQPLLHDAALGATADGGFTKSGAGVTTLSGVSTYSGPTTVNVGTLLVSGGLGTNVVTVNTNTTLSGTGTLNGATAVALGGTLQAGLGGNDTSTLTISNSLTLGGNAVFNLNRTNAQTANKISGLTTVNFGGTLTITNVGDALTNGDTFVLFTAAAYTGGFASISLPPLDPSLLWNTNNLAVNGTISVGLSISPSALALSSSSNPSGYLGAVAFTATVTPTNATGSVTFFNGATPISTNAMTLGIATSASISTLARGTNTITATYLGNVNYYGSTNTLGQVVTNHPPVATLAGYYRGAVPTWKILLTDIVTNIADADSDTITVTSLGTSTNGVTLTTGGGFVLYANANIVNDQFTYTVSDSNGGSTTGTVNLTAQAFLSGQSGTVTVVGSTATVDFAGIPGLSYTAQRSTNLTVWADILTTNAPSGGLFQVIDDFSDLGFVVPVSAYYRLQYNP